MRALYTASRPFWLASGLGLVGFFLQPVDAEAAAALVAANEGRGTTKATSSA